MSEKLFDRRDFMKSGLAGVGGLLLATSRPKETIATQQKIISRTLGNTGMRVPIVSMGVVSAGHPGLVRAALDAGIVYIDTAHDYHRGQRAFQGLLYHLHKSWFWQNCYKLNNGSL
jgi:hypothetical protein